MILHCTYEELQALTAGAEYVISGSEASGRGCAVAAPPEVTAQLELLLPRLKGDLSIGTYAELRRVRGAVDLILETLRSRLEGEVVEHHPAHEEAVELYFAYAHVLRVRDRLERMSTEMRAMIEVMTGHAPTAHAAESISFPD